MSELTLQTGESVPERRIQAVDFIGTVAVSVGVVNVLEDTLNGFNMPADAKLGAALLLVGIGIKAVNRLFNRNSDSAA